MNDLTVPESRESGKQTPDMPTVDASRVRDRHPILFVDSVRMRHTLGWQRTQEFDGGMCFALGSFSQVNGISGRVWHSLATAGSCFARKGSSSLPERLLAPASGKTMTAARGIWQQARAASRCCGHRGVGIWLSGAPYSAAFTGFVERHCSQ